MKTYFERAIGNVVRHGDTDIFPYPVENHLFFDFQKETIVLLEELHANFKTWIATYPPAHEGALTPVSYTGFRWATQLDPLWNLYLLALVLSIADAIEAQRVPKQEEYIFSYRYAWNDERSDIFDPDYNWRTFMECSLRKAEKHKFIVACDISEFYPRLSHHRLENALAHLGLQTDTPWRIREFLSNFSNTNSFGLPIGGPASRLLSELALNQVDQLLKLEGIEFCRFSDDFHIFADSMEDGFARLLSLTEKLQRNEGLQLQKSKTRIMSSAEFVATSPFRLDDDDPPMGEISDGSLRHKSQNLLRFSLRFDPYSPTAEDDYMQLKQEIERFDIIGILQAELSKSRVHISLAKKVIAAIRYLDPKQREQAIISIIENENLLYPIFSSVLIVVKEVFPKLSDQTQVVVIDHILDMVRTGSHVLRVELNLAYAIRVLACRSSPSVQEILVRLYASPGLTPLIRRDIILAMARWRVWPWLSDRRASFRSMSPAERRAFLLASYVLKDEGDHWRQHIKAEFNPFEKLVRDWAASKMNQPNWNVPL